MKIKQFVYWSPTKIKGLQPLKKATNRYGMEVYFYLVNNSNLSLFKDSEFSKQDFKEQKDEDFIWLLNRYAVSICNTDYLLNKFLNSDVYHKLNPENWTKTNVVLTKP